MKISDKELYRETDKLFEILYKLGLQKLLLTSLGNSIATGFSFNDINIPLFDRDKFLDVIAKNYGIDLEKHKFCRSENNSDEHIFQWIINNISENEINELNKRDYINHLKSGKELMTKEEIYETYSKKSEVRIQDIIFDESDSTANIVVYNGGTGSFLDNWTRKGTHLLTNGIKKDISYIEAILGLIQNNNREIGAKTQVYLCAVPRIVNTDLTNIFINSKLKTISNRYANTNYVKSFNRKPFYNVNGILIPDPHYNEKEYLILIYLILESLIKNYQFSDYLIEIDKKLYDLNKEVELSMKTRDTSSEILDIIKTYADLAGNNRIEFLNFCKRYLLERYPYDFSFLNRDAIKNQVKELKYN